MKTLTMLSVAGAVAFAVPALADDSTSTTPTTPSAEQQCRTERAQMGKEAFAQTYGTNKNRRNAFGKCVSHRSRATEANREEAHTNAAKQCKAEQAADATAFGQTYGTGKNAYGKCVSQKAKAQTAAETRADVKAEVSAAKACKAERTEMGKDAFAAKYGTNRNKRNAFGKCVSRTAKAQQDDQPATS